MCEAANVRRKPVCDPHAGPRRGARLRQARAARPIRSSTRSETRTHARHVTASPGLSALEQGGMTNFGRKCTLDYYSTLRPGEAHSCRCWRAAKASHSNSRDRAISIAKFSKAIAKGEHVAQNSR